MSRNDHAHPSRHDVGPARPRVGLVRSAGATALATGAATALTSAAWSSLAALVADGTGGLLRASVDELVALPFLGAGAVAAVVLALGCALLALSAATRAVGLGGRRLEAAGARLTPAVVRRALAVTVTAGLSLGATAGLATAAEPDLGWTVTASGAATSERAAPLDLTTTAPVAPGEQSAGTSAGTSVGTAVETPTSGTAPVAGTDPQGTVAADRSEAATTTGPSGTGAGTAALTGAAPAAPGPSGLEHGPAPEGATAAASTPTGATGTVGTTGATGTQATAPTGDPAGFDRSAAPASDGPAAAAQQHEVAPGDTLWAIAAAHLPPDATDADVAAAWPRWYSANRAVIGDDPDVIQPGQRLAAPPA
ncbi:LysM peptidoglycan-binding domain-containing protein [Actinotalea subterranea]|uniref:LysM peptidoglycan-binding domain-containing protein n=1 Tax=Actinotalea subterranea TaxID=2607497 RepID=UPI0011ECD8F8|nr:LysM peptidoglycan-binding domain-containing protein [Actinotalea subterranea]